MTLIDYLRQNSDLNVIDTSKHGLINDVIQKLTALGIDEPREVFRNVGIVKDGLTIGTVDLVVVSNDTLCVIEAKIMEPRSSASRTRNRLNRKLEKDYDYFSRQFGQCPRMIGIYRERGRSACESYDHMAPLEHLLEDRR